MTRGMFRLLLILNWVIVIAAILLNHMLFKRLPPDLQGSFRAYAYHSQPTRFNHIVLLADLLILVFSVVQSIGMFFFKKWARDLYLPLILLSCLIVGFAVKAVLKVGWEAPLVDLSALLSGVQLMAMYTEPLKSEFVKKRAA